MIAAGERIYVATQKVCKNVIPIEPVTGDGKSSVEERATGATPDEALGKLRQIIEGNCKNERMHPVVCDCQAVDAPVVGVSEDNIIINVGVALNTKTYGNGVFPFASEGLYLEPVKGGERIMLVPNGGSRHGMKPWMPSRPIVPGDYYLVTQGEGIKLQSKPFSIKLYSNASDGSDVFDVIWRGAERFMMKRIPDADPCLTSVDFNKDWQLSFATSDAQDYTFVGLVPGKTYYIKDCGDAPVAFSPPYVYADPETYRLVSTFNEVGPALSNKLPRVESGGGCATSPGRRP